MQHDWHVCAWRWWRAPLAVYMPPLRDLVSIQHS